MQSLRPLFGFLFFLCHIFPAYSEELAGLQNALKEAEREVSATHSALVKFSQEGSCENAEFQIQQSSLSEKKSELAALDKVINQSVAEDPKNSQVLNDLAEVRKNLQEARKADPVDNKKVEELTAQSRKLDGQLRKAREDARPDEYEKLRQEVNQLQDRLFVMVRSGLPDCEEAVTLNRAYDQAMEQKGNAVAALNQAMGLVAPADYLAAQTPPNFREDHTLPPLTRFGWAMPFELVRPFAEDWGYALGLEGYWGENRLARLANPETDEARIIALIKENPGKYQLSLLTNRGNPESRPEGMWSKDVDGKILNAQAVSYDGTEWAPGMRPVISPETPDSYWVEAGQIRANPIAEVQKLVPVSIVLNGGEWGLGVAGFAGKAWMADPRVQTRIEEFQKKEKNRFDYFDERKAHTERLVAEQVKAVTPDLELYVLYGGGANGHANRYGGWRNWGHDYDYFRGISTLPSNEHYVNHFNSGFVGDQDILSMSLNAIGRQIELGDPLSYSWFWAKRKDTSMRQYQGYLKCLYAAGVLGGNAGTYHQPDFHAGFDPNEPPDWMQQQMALAHVHALFSHLEDFLRNGDLVDDGKFRHFWSTSQPAYELLPQELSESIQSKTLKDSEERVGTLPMGRPYRVIARKHRDKDEWLVVAWTAEMESESGEHPATVEIPGAGMVQLLTRRAGSTYLVQMKDGKPVAKLLDPDEDFPSLAFGKK